MSAAAAAGAAVTASGAKVADQVLHRLRADGPPLTPTLLLLLQPDGERSPREVHAAKP